MSRLLWFVIGDLTTTVGMVVAALALDYSGSSGSGETVSKDNADNGEAELKSSKPDTDSEDIPFAHQDDAPGDAEGASEV